MTGLVDSHFHIWRQADLPWLVGPMQPRIFGPYEPIRRDYPITEYLGDFHGAFGMGAGRLQITAGEQFDHPRQLQILETQRVARMQVEAEPVIGEAGDIGDDIHVDTAEGRAILCGDVIYDFNDQIVTPFHEISATEPRTTGNHGVSKREEKAAIKKLLATGKFLLPVHDKPAKIEHGQVVGRMDMAVPGPVVQSLPSRNWFPA